MTLGTFIWVIIGKRIGLRERQLIMVDQNQSQLSGLVKLMRQILLIILLIELIGTIILGTHFLDYFSTWQEAYKQGLFATYIHLLGVTKMLRYLDVNYMRMILGSLSL